MLNMSKDLYLLLELKVVLQVVKSKGEYKYMLYFFDFYFNTSSVGEE